MSWLYGVTSGLAKSGAQIAEGKRAAQEAEFDRKMKQIYADTQAAYGRLAEMRERREQDQPARDLAKMDLENRISLEQMQKQHEYNVDLEAERRKTTPLKTFYRHKVGGKPWEWEQVTQMRDFSEFTTDLPSPPNAVQARQYNQAVSESMRMAAEEGVPVTDEHMQKAWDKIQTMPLAGQQQRLDIGAEQLAQMKQMQPLQITALKALIGLRKQQLAQGQTDEARKTTAEARATLNELIRMTEMLNPAMMSAPGVREAEMSRLADVMGIELRDLYDLMRTEGSAILPPPGKPTASVGAALPPPSRPGGGVEEFIQREQTR